MEGCFTFQWEGGGRVFQLRGTSFSIGGECAVGHTNFHEVGFKKNPQIGEDAPPLWETLLLVVVIEPFLR